MSFLACRKLLDPAIQPLDRVTRPTLRAYFTALRKAGNADATIIGRFDELARAAKILDPACDPRWIRAPAGVSIYRVLQGRQRALFVPDAVVLRDWGLELRASAAKLPTERERLCRSRDALMVGILAACGRRLRSFALLRIGIEIRRSGDCYRIELAPAQVKANRPDHFDLPPSLTAPIDDYLARVRPRLLGGRHDDRFWISCRGRPLSEKAIQTQITELSRQRFGTAFGPHRFRHAIATSAPRLAPQNPGLAAAILGISPEVVQESYNRAGQTQAALAFEAFLKSRQAELAGG